MGVTRWEDDARVWSGPDYGKDALAYDEGVRSAAVAGRIITCVDVVDWTGRGSRDLLLSSWDACYDGQVYLRRQTGGNEDGTPRLGAEERVEGVRGYVTSAVVGGRLHLVSTSRLRRQIHVYSDIGEPGAPRFGEPAVLDLEADWVKGNEYFHSARFHDIDGDGELELVVGSDFWGDYWPNGREWNDEGYRGFDAADRWLGGPLRGFLYAFRNRGTIERPVLDRGRPVLAGDIPLEVYGQLAPAFGNFGPAGECLVAGEFWNILHLARRSADGFTQTQLLCGEDDRPIELDQCIHFPCVVDWDGDGRPDILVGAEDGYVTFLKNVADGEDGLPRFRKMGRVTTETPLIHAGVLPSPAAFDFTGNGRPDLVVGNSTGELLFYENTGGGEGRACLGSDTMLQADGHPVRIAAGPTGSVQGPSEKMFGYSCPTIVDWDGDGFADLLVSDVTGYHRFFRNLGGEQKPPRFAGEQLLHYRGKPLKTVWRVRPAVADWRGDGALHYVALDEDGLLSDFRRQSDTELADKRHLRWDDGEIIAFTVDVGGGRGRVKLCLCDWEGEGRIDLIFGTHARASVPPGPKGMPRNTTGQAGLFYCRNVGTPEEPRFAKPVPMAHRGRTIAMAMHVASPEAVDWAGRGALDLIVGVEDGSLVWLKREDLSW
ncbi:FG-GAP repeat domain-containing protein [Jiella marina]|uniref:FG-GAP repeat domain-containing protein n=1 Tax=Jiella sp. LLJ827 TaxID=2917712 RepID=UPI002101408B|nr:VCBS repeat-containing protein [Jiella sp. LLJ827]MCQ0986049.1 VCBS repeat-containing protein [Jiella sp. LLJ827]